MKLIKYILIFFIVLSPDALLAQGAPSGKNGNVATYEKFFSAEMKKLDGVIPIYTNGEKYYIEIAENLLEKNLLISGIIVNGPWSGLASDISGIVSFSKGAKNYLNILRHVSSDRINEEASEQELINAVKNSSLQPISAVYPIEAMSKDGKGYILDVTKDVTVNGVLFSFANQKWVNKPDPKRSFVVPKITSNGVKFLNKRTQSDMVPSIMGATRPYEKNNTVVIEWAIQILPETDMRVRLADERVGYYTLSYSDYGVTPHSVTKAKAIYKWNIEPSDADKARYNAGKLVKPRNSINIYLDKTVPMSDRPAIEAAIWEWNNAFEKAGFKSVLVLKEGVPEINIAPYQITISCGLSFPKLQALRVENSATGEIISGIINYNFKYLSVFAEDDMLLFKSFNPKMKNKKSIQEAQFQQTRSKISNAIGSILGLTPNLAGSYAYTSDQLRNNEWLQSNSTTASIMDVCQTNYLVQSTDKQVDIANLYPRVSHYDRWAIEWGYRIFPKNKTEYEDQKALSSHLLKAKNNPYLLYVNEVKNDYRALRGDLGKDKIKVAELIANNIKRLYLNLSEISLGMFSSNDSWNDLLLSSSKLDLIYGETITYAMQAIGGVCTSPIIRGYSSEAVTFIPKSEQQAALQFMSQYVFKETPQWLKDRVLIDLTGNDGGNVSNLTVRAFATFLDPKFVSIMLKAENEHGSEVLTLNEIYSVFNKELFFDFNPNKAVNRYYRNLQCVFVATYADMINGMDMSKVYNDETSFLLAYFKKIEKKVKELSTTHKDELSRRHYSSMSRIVEREFKDTKLPAQDKK